MTSIEYCISVLSEKLIDLDRAGWQSVLAEHPERIKQIRHEEHLNSQRMKMLREGIAKLKSNR